MFSAGSIDTVCNQCGTLETDGRHCKVTSYGLLISEDVSEAKFELIQPVEPQHSSLKVEIRRLTKGCTMRAWNFHEKHSHANRKDSQLRASN
jgi:hypothetical protein